VDTSLLREGPVWVRTRGTGRTFLGTFLSRTTRHHVCLELRSVIHSHDSQVREDLVELLAWSWYMPLVRHVVRQGRQRSSLSFRQGLGATDTFSYFGGILSFLEAADDEAAAGSCSDTFSSDIRTDRIGDSTPRSFSE